jgi:hypothetical protein
LRAAHTYRIDDASQLSLDSHRCRIRKKERKEAIVLLALKAFDAMPAMWFLYISAFY